MRTIVRVIAVIAAVASPAYAQLPKPLPIATIDVRGFYNGLGRDAETAAQLFPPATISDMPGRGPGGVVGVHVYLLRGKNMAFGLGGEGVLAGANKQPIDSETSLPSGDPIHQRLKGMSGQISLNFGHRDGWSYLSAGMGPLGYYTYRGTARPAEAPTIKNTINLGAGARWFTSRHFAFTFDLRFYQTKPQEPTQSYPGRLRANIRVMSAGISIR